jgi:hypothetical protein
MNKLNNLNKYLKYANKTKIETEQQTSLKEQNITIKQLTI